MKLVLKAKVKRTSEFSPEELSTLRYFFETKPELRILDGLTGFIVMTKKKNFGYGLIISKSKLFLDDRKTFDSILESELIQEIQEKTKLFNETKNLDLLEGIFTDYIALVDVNLMMQKKTNKPEFS